MLCKPRQQSISKLESREWDLERYLWSHCAGNELISSNELHIPEAGKGLLRCETGCLSDEIENRRNNSLRAFGMGLFQIT
jgi:hypothetical protein